MKLNFPVGCLLFLLGCTAQVSKTVPNPHPAVPLSRPAAPVPTTSTPSRVFDESILRGKEFLLEAGSPTTVSAQDRVLGVLGTDPEIFRTIDRFFQQVSSASLDQTFLVDRWTSYLTEWASKIKASGFEAASVRVGLAIEDSQGAWNVPVRVLSKEKEYRGWVFLVPKTNGFLVSDVQIDAADFPATPFDPESQVQEISSPIRR